VVEVGVELLQAHHQEIQVVLVEVELQLQHLEELVWQAHQDKDTMEVQVDQDLAAAEVVLVLLELLDQEQIVVDLVE